MFTLALEAELSTYLSQLVLILARVGSCLMVMPVLGTRLVPARVRLLLALLLSFLLLGWVSFPAIEFFSFAFFIELIQQIVWGIFIGFSLQVLFEVAILAGQIIAMQAGLGFAALVDPANGASVTALSQFFLIAFSLLFLMSNGHIALFYLLAQSFEISLGSFSAEGSWQLVNLMTWAFSSALALSLPAICALLVINISFGVMSRAAPQLNIFAIGFPLTLIFGLLIVWLGSSSVFLHFPMLLESTFQFINQELLR